MLRQGEELMGTTLHRSPVQSRPTVVRTQPRGDVSTDGFLMSGGILTWHSARPHRISRLAATTGSFWFRHTMPIASYAVNTGETSLAHLST